MPGLAGTRAQSCDRYGSGTLHPGQVLGGSLPLLSPMLLYHVTLFINKKNAPYTCPMFNVVIHEDHKVEATEQYSTVTSLDTEI